MIPISECIKKIEAFCKSHNVFFQKNGEVGHNRPCVGIAINSTDRNLDYVQYNPTHRSQLHYCQYRSKYYYKKFDQIQPPKYWHKENCLTVMGTSDDSIRQLYNWILDLEEIGVKIIDFTDDNSPIENWHTAEKVIVRKQRKHHTFSTF